MRTACCGRKREGSQDALPRDANVAIGTNKKDGKCVNTHRPGMGPAPRDWVITISRPVRIPLPTGATALEVQQMNHHSRYDVSQRKRCDVPQEVPHGDNLLYGRRTPRRTHYTARPLMTRRTFSPSPPPPSPRYRSRHHTHKSNRSRAPFPLRPFGGVPSASPARSQIDAYGIGRRRSCELHHGKSSFHAGYPPQHATARGGGASDTPPLYP